ncbi:tellurite resistance/C4-dicarboxylate transporter family protein [Nitrosomonas eutropha]|nr:tellurite resistance/C4-dicarboxylate transporter family protein [Nitrosomonas eutropha]
MLFYPALFCNSIRDFHPSWFVMVMATGIVSIAFDVLDFTVIAKSLFVLNLSLYSIFCLLFIARIVFFPRDLLAELRILSRSWLFLAFVAGTNTVGVQLILFTQADGLANVLWCSAFFAWLVLISFIIFNILSLPRESVVNSICGGTLLLTVSTVSIVLLGSYLLDVTNENTWNFLMLWGIWILGCVLYLFVIYLIIRRLFFNYFIPENWQPSYWICMGAPAIITLAGSEYLTHLSRSLCDDLGQVTLEMSLLAWALGTLWIPYLLVMDIRKFTGGLDSTAAWIKIFPWARLACKGKYRTYDIEAWSRVFPAGMYTACTFSLAKVSGYYFLESISFYWCWFALLIWLLTLIGTFRSLINYR